MKQIVVVFSTGVQLTYDLKDTPVVDNWLSLLESHTRDSMHDRSKLYNHAHGFATADQIAANIIRLKEISNKYNLALGDINQISWHNVLNAAHVNFPNWRGRTDESIADAHEYNVLIHWLEYEFANLYEHRNEYLINVDFNQRQETRSVLHPFTDDDFKHFTPVLEFGNIHLHYVHKGRHFLELANANDLVAPSHHFVPQHRYSSTFGMVFSEPNARDYSKLRTFYDRRGVDFFRIPYDNPTMAIGFYKLGQLVNADQYRFDEQQRNDLRAKLADAVVVDWKINK